MRQSKLALLVVATFCLAPLLGGCKGKKAEEAKTEYAQVKDACAKGDKETAKKVTLELAAKNEVFKEAFDGATNTVSDKQQVNFCGKLVMTEIEVRLDANK